MALVDAAVSNRAGRTSLHLDGANFGAHSFEAGSLRTPTGRFVDVDAVPLDRFVDEARAFEAGVVVKVDVQGAEALVVEGARDLLGLPGVTVFLEFWPEALERAHADPRAASRGPGGPRVPFEDVGSPEAETPPAPARRDPRDVPHASPDVDEPPPHEARGKMNA